ncbi:MAG: hypothetical protein AMXMBFR13_41700 [Phycisphaerae bacterium]
MGRIRVAAVGAVLIVLAATVLQVVRADRACQGQFTYAMDEAYAHLTLARQMAAGGNADDHATAAQALAGSASPLWTSLLAGLVRLTGDPASAADPGWIERLKPLTPLMLNLLAAAMLLLLVGHMLRRDVRSSWGILGRLLAMAAIMPVPLLVLTGMEHLAHAFALLLAVGVGIELIERERLAAGPLLLAALWVALAVGLRYESLAAALGLLLWAWIRRRTLRALLPVVAAVSVVSGVGVFLAVHGESWLPDAMRLRLLDGGGGWGEWVERAIARAVSNLREALVPAVLVMVAATMLWSRREQQSSPDADDRIRVAWLFVFVVAGAVHLLLGPADDRLRYTAYLVPLGSVAILRALANRPGAKWAPSAPVGLRYSVMAVICLLPLAAAAVPAVRAAWGAPEVCRDVYVRNRMAASFVRTFFPERVVGGDEIGALSYGTQARVVDLPRARMERTFVQSAAPVAVAFQTGRADGDFPTLRSWVRVGGWRPVPPVIGGGVSVYAPLDQEGDVRRALRLFPKGLPEGVEIWLVEPEQQTASAPAGSRSAGSPGVEAGNASGQ